jgi:putative Holliday junction resolvase
VRAGVRIGVDVGSVRVGVAASDPAGVLATPVTTLRRDVRRGSDLQALAGLVAEREAVEVLVGLPRTMSGRAGAAVDAARSYAVAVARRVAPVPVRLVDERLSTVSASRALRESGVRGQAARAVVDAAAAVVLLQTGLDEERSTGRPPGEPLAGGPV